MYVSNYFGLGQLIDSYIQIFSLDDLYFSFFCACLQDAAAAANSDASARYQMIDARLRRLCEKKPSGKVNVPDSVHQQWMAGGAKRDELRKLFEQYECDKDCIYQVTFFNWGVGDNYTCFCMHPWRQEMPSHMSNSYNMHNSKNRTCMCQIPQVSPKVLWSSSGGFREQSGQDDRAPQGEFPGNSVRVVHSGTNEDWVEMGQDACLLRWLYRSTCN